jgi:hypothetical protein
MKRNSIAVLIFAYSLTIFSQNIYEGPELVAFADYLFENKDFSNANSEYQRALYLGHCNSSCKINLLNTFLQTRNYQSGIDLYQSVYTKQHFGNDTLTMIYGKLLVLNSDFSNAMNLIDSSIFLSADQKLYLNIACNIQSNKWEIASKLGTNINENSVSSLYTPLLYEIEHIKFKNPYKGLLLSAIVPGSGKAYAGYWYDGLISFSMVGIAAWQTYRGFTIYGPRNTYSWIFAALSTSFYLSNLYGSFKAVNMKNYFLRLNIHNRCENILFTSYTD